MRPFVTGFAMVAIFVAGMIGCIEVISVPQRDAAKARQAECATRGGALVLDMSRVERCVKAVLP
jgi:hypothetical protein